MKSLSGFRIYLFALGAICCHNTFANDGAFYFRGNQLIPIIDQSVSVKKEILNITRISQEYVSVDVYYEFLNPGKEKKILIGFEAMSPHGDASGSPVNGGHPYMNNFTVEVNNISLPFKIAIVKDSAYYIDKKFVTSAIDQEAIENENYVDFFYVYHFNATLKKGINTIRHRYQFKLSSSVNFEYNFEYVLTAAKRWANKQIDDFTLHINLGAFQIFQLDKSFFESAQDWKINGFGKTLDIERDRAISGTEQVQFILRDSGISFHQINFKPAGEIYLYAPNWHYMFPYERFDYKTHILPFPNTEPYEMPTPSNDSSNTILKNLPFARRGYIFKDKMIQSYYESLDWYMPDPLYQAEMKNLSPFEQKWVLFY